MTCRISVVVPTFKRPDLLHRCLTALTTQNLDPEDYEIIIVDDAASDTTRQQVEWRAKQTWRCKRPPMRFAEGPTVRYIPVTGTHGPAAARNLGWRSAQGHIVAFTDDDCIPAPGWLCAGLSAFEDGKTGAIGAIGAIGASGKILVPLTCAPTDYELDASHLETSEFVTANCFYRRDILALVGGFDERFTMAWREDSDLFFTISSSPFLLADQSVRSTTDGNALRCASRSRPIPTGSLCLAGGLVHVPQAVVIHPIRPAPWGISLKQQRKSMFNALLYKKHPLLYRQKIQATPPWHYYCILGALLVACISALAGFWALALGALCVWAIMTGRFCAQRLHSTSHTPRHVAEMIVTSILIPPLSIFWRIVGAIKFRVFFL